MKILSIHSLGFAQEYFNPEWRQVDQASDNTINIGSFEGGMQHFEPKQWSIEERARQYGVHPGEVYQLFHLELLGDLHAELLAIHVEKDGATGVVHMPYSPYWGYELNSYILMRIDEDPDLLEALEC